MFAASPIQPIGLAIHLTMFRVHHRAVSGQSMALRLTCIAIQCRDYLTGGSLYYLAQKLVMGALAKYSSMARIGLCHPTLGGAAAMQQESIEEVDRRRRLK